MSCDDRIVHVGVDVGGTNTDAAVLMDDKVVGWAKRVTTADVTTGVASAISSALNQALEQLNCDSLNVRRVHIGTTHFVNAIVQRQNVAKVCVIRLCGPATRDLHPFIDFPDELKDAVCGPTFMIDGGYEYDGSTEIRPVDENQVLDVISKLKAEQFASVVISGIFSPVNNAHEVKVQELFKVHYPEATLTLTHEIGQIGLLERENAAVLNESLKPLCRKMLAAFRNALDGIGLQCPFFFTQNDGTLNSAEQTLEQPVNTFASGPTNSMRGAAFLSGLKDAVVVDIGGTSTDVGVLIGGFPKEASFKVKVGNVRTNFRMPDVLSIGLGGGSKVIQLDNKVKIGPESVGYRLREKALVFGGDTTTASDLAVAGGLVDMGDSSLLKDNSLTSNPELVTEAVHKIRQKVEDTIDQVKTNREEVPVILVGGGSVLIDSSVPLKGTSRVHKPPNFDVANAVGAALSQVSGSVDYTVDLSATTREAAIKQAKERATRLTIVAGADPDSITIVEVSEVPLAYLPSNVTRVKVKAVGDLSSTAGSSTVSLWTAKNFATDADVEGVLQSITASGEKLTPDTDTRIEGEVQDPTIDPVTGEWIISEWDVECIAVGAGILGCGGGGSPYLGKLMTLKKLKEGHVIRVVTPERAVEAPWWPSESYVTSVGGMGAPTIGIERKATTPNEFYHALCGLEHILQNLDAVLELENCNSEAPGSHNVSIAARAMSKGCAVVGVAEMGAPTISIERLSTIDELSGAVYALSHVLNSGYNAESELMQEDDIKKENGIHYMENTEPKTAVMSDKKIVAVFSAEIGGTNSMTPLYVAPLLGLPVIDCDAMGRAFPELQHFTPTIYGSPPYPACLCDYNGRTNVVLKADSPKQLEDHFRRVCVRMGCAAALAGPPLRKDDIHGPECKVVTHSLSRAWRLGAAVWKARRNKESPINAILEHEGGKLLFAGKVCDIQRKTTGGFARGELFLEGFDNSTMIIYFQNENLVAKLKLPDTPHQVVACVPDLISLVDYEQGEPIPTEEVRYGLRVAVLGLPASPLLCTPTALAVVGPQAFGYPEEEVKFVPLGEHIIHKPIPMI